VLTLIPTQHQQDFGEVDEVHTPVRFSFANVEAHPFFVANDALLLALINFAHKVVIQKH